MTGLIKWIYRVGGTLLGGYIFVAMVGRGLDEGGIHILLLSLMGFTGGYIVVKNYWEEAKSPLTEIPYPRDPKKAYILWAWEDVKTLRPTWTDHHCQVWLDSNAKYLVDRSIELGWGVMEDLLPPKGETPNV
jgi:hypothetical protein